jgi:ABC-type nitrate/sulfonate/bicarbonate transport system ATPase subunit
MIMEDELLSVRNLVKRFGAQTVIENLSFSIQKGGRVTIFAPSGAGKTTLINILTGLDHDYEGAFSLAAENPATIFQEPRLFAYMTVQENIFLPARIRRTPITQHLLDKCGRWLEVCDLSPYTHHYPYQLSGGMKQKVALIRGFLTDPDFVMMDEPFTSIDARSKQALICHILDSYPGITVLFVTHIPDEVALMTESLLLFRANRLAEFVMYDASHLSASPPTFV